MKRSSTWTWLSVVPIGVACACAAHADHRCDAAHGFADRSACAMALQGHVRLAQAGKSMPTAEAAPKDRGAVQKFVIEREIPGAGKMTPEQLRDAARQSNSVLRDLGPDIQWVHSYVTGDKLYCVYHAPSEALIRAHAQKSGFPATKITPVAAIIDPSTAHGQR